jgi:hypothetical protein
MLSIYLTPYAKIFDLYAVHTFRGSNNLKTISKLDVGYMSKANTTTTIDFQSQASWGRLELKPNKSHKSRFRHMNSCFPSTPTCLKQIVT